MTELERELRRTAAAVEYPPTPALAEAVAQRLREEGASQPRRLGGRPPALRVALVATAIFLLLAGGVVAAVPAARHALLDLAGLRGATVIRVAFISGNVEARPGLGLAGPISDPGGCRSQRRHARRFRRLCRLDRYPALAGSQPAASVCVSSAMRSSRRSKSIGLVT